MLMSTLSIDSREFQDTLHNLRFEEMSLSRELQEKVIQTVNSRQTITPKIIKKIVADAHGKV